MADLEAPYRRIIQAVYEMRHKNNPRYSQNAFARSLGLSSAYFSKLIDPTLTDCDPLLGETNALPKSRKQN